jgi:hypothetical protein
VNVKRVLTISGALALTFVLQAGAQGGPIVGTNENGREWVSKTRTSAAMLMLNSRMAP